jgi:predicted amidophosphoribosyltransferase
LHRSGSAAPRTISLLGFDPLAWLLSRPCSLCRRRPATKTTGSDMDCLCDGCGERLALPATALQGQWPLPWWSSGTYSGVLRQTLLDQKCRRADPGVLRALLQPLLAGLRPLQLPRRGRQAVLLVPIPSWKRRPNPLPGLIADHLAAGLGLRRRDLLARSHPVLGQHHLGRQLRQANQEGSFQLQPVAHARRPAPVLLVDDILTTGSTLQHAALCLEKDGWPVLGAACLARTPNRRDWLRTP